MSRENIAESTSLRKKPKKKLNQTTETAVIRMETFLQAKMEAILYLQTYEDRVS